MSYVGRGVIESVSGVIKRHKLPWCTLDIVTKHGSPDLTGKNVRLLKTIQGKVKENNLEQEVIFLHSIIHQGSLCKSVLQLDHGVKPVVKLLTYLNEGTSAWSVY